jgi:hypothetical protein
VQLLFKVSQTVWEGGGLERQQAEYRQRLADGSIDEEKAKGPGAKERGNRVCGWSGRGGASGPEEGGSKLQEVGSYLPGCWLLPRPLAVALWLCFCCDMPSQHPCLASL